MVFGLFGRKPVAEVGVRLDRAEYRPGEMVRVSVRIVPAKDLVEPEIGVALLHVDRYRDESGWRLDEWAVDGRYLTGGRFDTTLRAGVPVDAQVELTVPERTVPFPEDPVPFPEDEVPEDRPAAEDVEDHLWLVDEHERWGPPTGRGSAVVSEWQVQVSVPAKRGGVDERVAVVVPAEPGSAPAAAVRRRGSATAADLAFSGLPATSLAPGALVTGTLHVTARRELDTRGLRVALVRCETAVADDRVLEFAEVDRTPQTPPVRLAPGATRDVPFSLRVPADAAPTMVSEGFTLRWLLRGTVDLPRREDEVGDQEIAVHG